MVLVSPLKWVILNRTHKLYYALFIKGWNVWNHFGCNYNETIIKRAADTIVSTGLAAAGYQYGIVNTSFLVSISFSLLHHIQWIWMIAGKWVEMIKELSNLIRKHSQAVSQRLLTIFILKNSSLVSIQVYRIDSIISLYFFITWARRRKCHLQWSTWKFWPWIPRYHYLC